MHVIHLYFDYFVYLYALMYIQGEAWVNLHVGCCYRSLMNYAIAEGYVVCVYVYV